MDLLQLSRCQYAAAFVMHQKHGFALADEPRLAKPGIDSFCDALALNASEDKNLAEKANRLIREVLLGSEANRVASLHRRLSEIIQYVLEEYSNNMNGLREGFYDVLAKIDSLISQKERLKLAMPTASLMGTSPSVHPLPKSNGQSQCISGRTSAVVGPGTLL